jgi:bacterioferritin-associated ferredoxin
MRCIVAVSPLENENCSQSGSGFPLYVCNCNGIRERDVRQAIAAGASRPAEVFRSQGCQAQCAKCVCEMRQMIDESREALRYAAE